MVRFTRRADLWQAARYRFEVARSSSSSQSLEARSRPRRLRLPASQACRTAATRCSRISGVLSMTSPARKSARLGEARLWRCLSATIASSSLPWQGPLPVSLPGNMAVLRKCRSLWLLVCRPWGLSCLMFFLASVAPEPTVSRSQCDPPALPRPAPPARTQSKTHAMSLPCLHIPIVKEVRKI